MNLKANEAVSLIRVYAQYDEAKATASERTRGSSRSATYLVSQASRSAYALNFYSRSWARWRVKSNRRRKHTPVGVPVDHARTLSTRGVSARRPWPPQLTIREFTNSSLIPFFRFFLFLITNRKFEENKKKLKKMLTFHNFRSFNNRRGVCGNWMRNKKSNRVWKSSAGVPRNFGQIPDGTFWPTSRLEFKSILGRLRLFTVRLCRKRRATRAFRWTAGNTRGDLML